MRKRLLQFFALLVASAVIIIALPMGHVSAASTTVGAVISSEQCKEVCEQWYNDEMDRCKRLRKERQRLCRSAAMNRYSKCLRDCDRKK
jgi:hypothetical protein